jgi:hypothetical protein
MVSARTRKIAAPRLESVELLRLSAMGLWEHAARDLSAMVFALITTWVITRLITRIMTRETAAQDMVIVEPLKHIVEIHGTLHLLLLEHAAVGKLGMETAPILMNAALSLGSAESLKPIVEMAIQVRQTTMETTIHSPM